MESQPSNLNDGDWDLVRMFLALIDCGSLTAAARQLGVSQPTVSRQLDALEARLGVLFARTSQGLVATATALDLVEPAQQMASSWAKMTRVATGHAESLAGIVRLTASRPVSTYVMPSVCAELRLRWPEIQLELVASDVVQDLSRRDADIAVRNVRPTQQDVVSRKIGEMAIGLFAGPDYAKRRALPTTVAELLTHELIGLDRSDDIIRGFAEAGVVVDRNAFSVRCDDLIVLVELIAAGVGLGFVSVTAGRARGLIQIPLQLPRLPVWIAMHREVQTSRRIRVIADALVTSLAPRFAD
jgi:DNA-binding transcriptional LysR family regulator